MSIKALVLDRDSVINHASKDPASPFYYILRPSDLVLKPNVREAFDLLRVLQRETGLKVYLATKQRCISKGLISRAQINEMHQYLQDLVRFSFDDVYVEESAPDKRALYAAVLRDSGAAPDEIMVIDDSEAECAVAQGVFQNARFGGLFNTICTGDLCTAVCRAFSIS